MRMKFTNKEDLAEMQRVQKAAEKLPHPDEYNGCKDVSELEDDREYWKALNVDKYTGESDE